MSCSSFLSRARRTRAGTTFIKDVGRLEVLLRDELADHGFAVALTNDPAYWQGGDREDVADAAFRLGEGRILAGVMDWAAHTGAGTKRSREQPLSLVGSDELQWRDFSQSSAPCQETAPLTRYLNVPYRPPST